MISKEKFIEYLERYKELVDIEEKVDETLKLLNPDFNSLALDKHGTLILDMLKDLADDKFDLIDYFVYELDWGKNGKNCITEKDGKRYSLTNYNELYECIKSNS